MSVDSQNFQGGSLTIGKFDGLHLGHQRLLQALTDAPRIVITFDPLPIQVLRPLEAFGRLFPKSDLEEQLPRFGMDLLVVLPFSPGMAAQSAVEFAEHVIRPFQPRRVVVGHDFAMGRNREGDVDWLKSWCRSVGILLDVTPPFQFEGGIVSSGRVRELVRTGAVDAAARLLGRPFYLRGPVVDGAGRGGTIGVPTLNLRAENQILPALGVYATRTRWKGQVFDSVTNVGRVPTFTDQSEVHVETHVMGRDLSARGDLIGVEFVQRLRPETKFGSVEDLKMQIKRDMLEAERVLRVKS